jgi:16S rRNA (guanine1516-N2)-methyltransferase
VSLSFDDPALVHRRRGGQNELLGRAVGWRRDRAPTVLDATAGFGRDAFVLADLGCEVLLCEREPVMALLLERALADGAFAAVTIREACARMRLHVGDARDLPEAMLEDIDVICVDPMFAAPRRGAVGKAMQALQLLTGVDAADAGATAEADALLGWARTRAVRRVVVKRPRRAPALGGTLPSHVLSGRAVRFDVYMVEGSDREQGDTHD